jgi:NAD(P)-dependent dehydrogenase (short-subunit alcohol dehydrogenase family)
MSQRTWFITGVSSGFGRELTDQLLERGDRVVGTVRDTSKIAALSDRYPDSLFAEVLDVTDRDAENSAEDRLRAGERMACRLSRRTKTMKLFVQGRTRKMLGRSPARRGRSNSTKATSSAPAARQSRSSISLSRSTPVGVITLSPA